MEYVVFFVLVKKQNPDRHNFSEIKFDVNGSHVLPSEDWGSRFSTIAVLSGVLEIMGVVK